MFSNTVKDSTGEILTGKIWRKHHGFLKDLPFYSNVPRMDEMALSLLEALSEYGLEKFCVAVLMVSKSKFQILIYSKNMPLENQQRSR
jgi:hypothetical protein